MSKEEVKVFGPATVSNVGPGFDLMGFALESPGDEMIIRRNGSGSLVLVDESGCNLPWIRPRMWLPWPLPPCWMNLGYGKDSTWYLPGKSIPEAGWVRALPVVWLLWWESMNSWEIPSKQPHSVPYAMEGEKIASGATHADNIAPALLGGITLIRGYDPLDIKHIPYPADLWCAVIHPHLEIKTLESRKLIPARCPSK